MLCGTVYIRKYLGWSGKIAALSPCIAKKDEFDQTGLVQYNVTFKHIKKYLDDNGININSIKVKGALFDNEKGLTGAIYPRPGGLKRNLQIFAPNLRVINSEGVKKVYHESKNILKRVKKISLLFLMCSTVNSVATAALEQEILFLSLNLTILCMMFRKKAK